MVVSRGRVTTVELVGGTVVDETGGAWVVVVSAGGSVVVVVATGGAGGEVVVVTAGRVVTTGGRMVPAPPAGAAVVVVLGSTEVDVAGADVVGPRTTVLSGRTVVVGRWVVGDWVATCFGDVSAPVATSNRRAAKATDARAYSPTLKR